MATLEKVGKRWRVRQFIGGKLQTIASCDTKPDAERVKRRLDEEEAARGTVLRGSALPMTEVLARWRIAKLAEGNDELSTIGAETRVRTICAAQNWGTTAAITPIAVNLYRTGGGSPRACAYVASILRWAHDTLDQFVDPKTLVALKPGRTKRKPMPPLMTPEAVAAVEAVATRESDGAGALIHCLSTYGWRPITAARLLVSDFDQVGGTITCRVKGGDVVRHKLLPVTVSRLRDLVASASPSDPLFRNPQTGIGWAFTGGHTISRWSRDHLRLKVYELKRYAITTMLNKGIPPQDIAQFTGHRTIAQVLRYARTNEARQAATLEILGKAVESEGNAALPQVVGGCHNHLLNRDLDPSRN